MIAKSTRRSGNREYLPSEQLRNGGDSSSLESRKMFPANFLRDIPSAVDPPAGEQTTTGTATCPRVLCVITSRLRSPWWSARLAWVDGRRDASHHPGAGGPRRRPPPEAELVLDLRNGENFVTPVAQGGWCLTHGARRRFTGRRLERQREGGRPEGARGPSWGRLEDVQKVLTISRSADDLDV